MKSEMGDRVRLLHIFEAIKEIEQATTGKNYDDFYNDHVLRIAVVKWLEIIGEASNHISRRTKEYFTALPWKEMIALRNIVVHEYFGINFSMIWEIVQLNLPELENKIEKLIDNYNDTFSY